jgi:hypothetical protein
LPFSEEPVEGINRPSTVEFTKKKVMMRKVKWMKAVKAVPEGREQLVAVCAVRIGDI